MTAGGSPILDLVGDFERSLRAQNKSRKTITAYTVTAREFAEWSIDNDQPADVLSVEREHVEAWIVHQLDSYASSTALSRYRWLQQFWRWVVEENEREISPMVNMSPPQVEELPVPVYNGDDMRLLLKACEGKDFKARRDTAIIRMFRATGVRLDELVGMNLESLARDEQAVLVIGKGNRGRWVPYSDKASVALDRYLRERRRHNRSHLEALWIGQMGALTGAGVEQILNRRAQQAGLEGVRPHRFRHDTAHRAKDAGMSDDNMKEIFGWRSQQMVERYGASARAGRARAAYRRLDIEGDI